MKRLPLALLLTIASCCVVDRAVAQQAADAGATVRAALPPFAEPGDESAQYVVETVLADLAIPCGIAVRPGAPDAGPYELFISGGGQIVRFSTDKPGASTAAVTDFPLSAGSDAPQHRLRPMGLDFLTRTKLTVGVGGTGDGAPSIRVYALPEDDAAVAFDNIDHAVELTTASRRAATGGAGHFQLFGMTKTEDALYAASGDESHGWILKARIEANRLTELQTFVATNSVSGVENPRAVVVNPKPQAHYLVAGQMGDVGAERDSAITFYGPVSGEVALNLRTGLYDVAGLAYSPTGDLYAIDYSWHDGKSGGVYRIDAAEVDGRQSCQAVKIAAASLPAAMAFTPDGALYVGASERGDSDDTDKPRGVLLKISPKPGTPAL